MEQLLLPLHPPGSPPLGPRPTAPPARSLSPLFDRLYKGGVEKMRRRRRPPPRVNRITASPRTHRIKGGKGENNKGKALPAAAEAAAGACDRLYASGLKSRASRVDLHDSRPLPAECTFMPSTRPRMKAASATARSVAQRKRQKMQPSRESDFAERLYKEAGARRHRLETAAAAVPEGCSFSPSINNRGGSGGVGAGATDRLYKSGLQDLQRKKKQHQARQRKRKVKMSLSAEGGDRLFKQAQEREQRLDKLRHDVDEKMTFKPTLISRRKGQKEKEKKAPTDKQPPDTKQSNNSNKATAPESNDEAEPNASYLGKEHNDVRGLVGVDDDLEDVMLQQASELVSSSVATVAPAQEIADDADRNGSILCHAVAMYDYKARDPTRELGFTAGDVVACTEMDNSDGWWHGSLNGAWGAFPLTYVHCVLKFASEDYLLLPADWAVHRSSGKKEKVGTFDMEKKSLSRVDGTIEDWGESTFA